MKLPSLKRIYSQDWLAAPERIILILNNFMQNCYALLNGGLTLADNVDCSTISVKVNGDRPNTTFDTKRQVTAVLLLKLEPAATSAPSLEWRQVGNKLEITKVWGLAAATDYTAKLLIL